MFEVFRRPKLMQSCAFEIFIPSIFLSEESGVFKYFLELFVLHGMLAHALYVVAVPKVWGIKVR